MRLVKLQVYLISIIFSLTGSLAITTRLPVQAQAPAVKQVDAKPSPRPDRIILTWQTDPTNSQTVTWRTDNTVKNATAEIALADASANFAEYATALPARTKAFQTENGAALYHSVNFTQLKPNTLYVYRVGNGTYWSEWFQFRTAKDQPEPFSFLYFGDVQNQVFSQWSRVIRAAYAEMPKAKFMVYAGDLINHAEDDTEWHEWFTAGSFIYATIPSLIVPGNHEYARSGVGLPRITRLWEPQFNFPDNGLKSQEGLVYYTDYQNLRVICLNSYWFVPAQARWLEEVLRKDPKQWTVVTFHYPVLSTTGRGEDNLIRHWKPIFDKYGVDLVLQGHDHTYARGTLPAAHQPAKTNTTGPVYVVSISGPKMYAITDHSWATRTGENTQLYQIISIDKGKLLYKSQTVTGELYDGFELIKAADGTKELRELKPEITPERKLENTLKSSQK